MTDQMILAVRKDRLPDKFLTTGFYAMSHSAITSLLIDAGLWLGPRSHLEHDDTFRQIIPYIVLKRDDRVVCYRRSDAGSERRLHGLLSIGLGGHVDMKDTVSVTEDLDLDATLHGAAWRELREELKPVNVLAQHWVGVLAENSSSVGRVHLGVVGVWSIGPEAVDSAEEAIRETRLIQISQATSLMEEFETWSALLLPALRSGLI